MNTHQSNIEMIRPFVETLLTVGILDGAFDEIECTCDRNLLYLAVT